MFLQFLTFVRLSSIDVFSFLFVSVLVVFFFPFIVIQTATFSFFYFFFPYKAASFAPKKKNWSFRQTSLNLKKRSKTPPLFNDFRTCVICLKLEEMFFSKDFSTKNSTIWETAVLYFVLFSQTTSFSQNCLFQEFDSMMMVPLFPPFLFFPFFFFFPFL